MIKDLEVFLKGDITQEHNSKGHYFSKNELKNTYSDWKIISYKEYNDYDTKEEQMNQLAFMVAKR